MSINWKSKKVRIILAVIVFAVVVIGYLLWQRKKLKAKHKQLLEKKESLIKEQESLNELVSELEEIQSNFSDPEPTYEQETNIEWKEGNDEFPLRRNKFSQGRNVKALQIWLQQYQGEELPKYGADGRFNEETEMACIRVAGRDNISRKFFVNRRELLGIQNKLMK